MNAKIAGVLIFLAGTATVFAATHSSINDNGKSQVSGIADFVSGIDKELNMEMEFVGLQPNSLYVARLENTACQNLPREASRLPNGQFVATFVESNQFGSYSNIIKGLPAYAENSRSVALYSDSDTDENNGIKTVYCVNLG